MRMATTPFGSIAACELPATMLECGTHARRPAGRRGVRATAPHPRRHIDAVPSHRPPPILTEGVRMSDVTLPTTSESAGPSAVKRAGRAAAYVFWIMFLINFLNYFDRFIFLGLEKSIQDTLHLSDFELGTAVGVFLLVYTLVALPLGFMADRIARKTVVAVGVAVWSVASFATGFAANAVGLLGLPPFLGLGGGGPFPPRPPPPPPPFSPPRPPGGPWPPDVG